MAHPPYLFSVRLDSFEVLGPYERGAVLRHEVETFVLANSIYLARVRVPPLYQAGVRYVDTGDDWRDIPAVQRARGGDCKDLVAWRVAELRHGGQNAVPRIVWIQDDAHPGEYLYHVIVGLPGGRFEDPSALLGMH